MHRRHFTKLSATALATLLFNRVTYAKGGISLINHPEEVWAQTGAEWFKLNAASGDSYTFKDIAVSFKVNGNARGVYVQSPTLGLTGVRLKWKHSTPNSAKSLGDSWERTYGDKAWRDAAAGIKNPWYVLVHDDKQTSCFGVKTGCNAICWWGG